MLKAGLEVVTLPTCVHASKCQVVRESASKIQETFSCLCKDKGL